MYESLNKFDCIVKKRSMNVYLKVMSAFESTIECKDSCVLSESESESERYLFDPHKKLIQSNNEKQLGSGDPY